MAFNPDPLRITLIVGIMGSGKTSKAIEVTARLLQEAPTWKLFCVNPHEDPRFPTSVTELAACPCDDETRWRAGQPHAPFCLSTLRDTVVLIDEIGYFQSPHQIPRQLREFIFRARLRNNSLIATTQRVRDHNQLLLANVAAWYLFRTQSPSDLDTIREIPLLGPAIAVRVPTLAPGECLHVSRNSLWQPIQPPASTSV